MAGYSVTVVCVEMSCQGMASVGRAGVGSAFLEKICAITMHTTEAAVCCHLITMSLF